MEILKFLLSFLAEEYYDGKELPFLKLLEECDFDFTQALKRLDPKTIAPVLKDVMQMFSNKKPQDNSCGLNPILNVANGKIVYGLKGALS